MRNTLETGQTIGVDEVTKRGNGLEEPTLALPSGYIDAYREGLRKSGVCEQDIERNVATMTDSLAREERAKTEKTVEVEEVSTEEAFDRVNTAVKANRGFINEILNGSHEKRALRQASYLLVETETTRRINGEAARSQRDPLKVTQSAIEGLAAVTHTEIFPTNPIAVPVETQPTLVFDAKKH